jgi:hypothetical protein
VEGTKLKHQNRYASEHDFVQIVFVGYVAVVPVIDTSLPMSFFSTPFVAGAVQAS